MKEKKVTSVSVMHKRAIRLFTRGSVTCGSDALSFVSDLTRTLKDGSVGEKEKVVFITNMAFFFAYCLELNILDGGLEQGKKPNLGHYTREFLIMRATPGWETWSGDCLSLMANATKRGVRVTIVGSSLEIHDYAGKLICIWQEKE